MNSHHGRLALVAPCTPWSPSVGARYSFSFMAPMPLTSTVGWYPVCVRFPSAVGKRAGGAKSPLLQCDERRKVLQRILEFFLAKRVWLTRSRTLLDFQHLLRLAAKELGLQPILRQKVFRTLGARRTLSPEPF